MPLDKKSDQMQKAKVEAGLEVQKNQEQHAAKENAIVMLKPDDIEPHPKPAGLGAKEAKESEAAFGTETKQAQKELIEQIQESEFNAQETYRELARLANEQANVYVQKLLLELHPDDVQNAIRALSFISLNSLGSIRHGTKMLQERAKQFKKGAAGNERKTKKELDDLMRQFAQEITSKLINQEYNILLQLDNPDSQALRERADQIYKATLTTKITGATDMVRYVLDQKLSQLKRLERQQRKDEEAAAKEDAETTSESVERQEKAEPQEWLDQEREAAFMDFAKELIDLETTEGEEALKQFFIDMFNPWLKRDKDTELTLEDVQSLSVQYMSVKSISQVAGKEIIRPVFKFDSWPEYQKFSEVVQGHAGSMGMNIPGNAYSENSPLHKTGLIIATKFMKPIVHEMTHSIDPHRDTRKGTDAMLTEAFAHYQEFIGHKEETTDNDWTRFAAAYSNEIYYEQLGNDVPGTHQEYRELGNQVADAIRQLYEAHGHIQAMREIVQCQTVEELLEKAK